MTALRRQEEFEVVFVKNGAFKYRLHRDYRTYLTSYKDGPHIMLWCARDEDMYAVTPLRNTLDELGIDLPILIHRERGSYR